MTSKLLTQLRNPVLPAPLGGTTVAEGGTALGGLIGALVGGMFIFGFILALFFIMTGAFHWITSGGDKTNLEQARNKIIHSIVGLMVLAAAWAIMVLLGQFFGIDFPEIKIPSIPNVLNSSQAGGGGGGMLR